MFLIIRGMQWGHASARCMGQCFSGLGLRFFLTWCPFLLGHLRDSFTRVPPGTSLWKTAFRFVGSASIWTAAWSTEYRRSRFAGGTVGGNGRNESGSIELLPAFALARSWRRNVSSIPWVYVWGPFGVWSLVFAVSNSISRARTRYFSFLLGIKTSSVSTQPLMPGNFLWR